MLRIEVYYIFSWYIWLVGPRLNLRLTDCPRFVSRNESAEGLLICYGVTRTIYYTNYYRVSRLGRRWINYTVYTKPKPILSVNLTLSQLERDLHSSWLRIVSWVNYTIN